MTLLSSRELILQHRPPRYEDVPVPELTTGADPEPVARIQALNGTGVDRFVGSLWTADGKYIRQDYAAKLVALCWVDSEGNRVFKDGDVPALGLMDGALIGRLAVVAERLSGLAVKPDNAEKN